MTGQLYAIITGVEDAVFKIDWHRDFDHVLTFERDGARYQRSLGKCDVEHIEALCAAMRAHAAIATAELDNEEASA
jgi:hypothetical protein